VEGEAALVGLQDVEVEVEGSWVLVGAAVGVEAGQGRAQGLASCTKVPQVLLAVSLVTEVSMKIRKRSLLG
jgi:hypothetical protein